jgi:putative phosphoribosyl transferase
MEDVRPRTVTVEADGLTLPGDLAIPEPAIGVVVFAHGSGSSRRSPRNARVAERLQAEGLGTLLFDLLTDDEAGDRDRVFDIELLARRLEGTVSWLRRQPDPGHLPMAFFGASTGAAAALVAAAGLGSDVASVVSRGGRPDLAGDALEVVTAPTLLIVGGADRQVLELNRRAQGHLRCETRLEIVPGATHLFEEQGALEGVAELAAAWFTDHLG